MTTLLIQMPTSGHVQTQTVETLIGLTQRLQSEGIAFAFKTHQFSDVVMSRNALMSFFLSHEEFSHTLLLDSDLSFKPKLVFDMLGFDEDFVVAPYCKRSLNLQQLVQKAHVASAEDIADPAAFIAKSLSYIATKHIARDKPITPKTRGDFHTIAFAGTGFMLLKRSVPERMVETGAAHPLPRTGRLPLYKEMPRFHDFFSHRLTQEKDAVLGEDSSFCLRWLEDCGGEVWAKKGAKISHNGNFSFEGIYGISP